MYMYVYISLSITRNGGPESSGLSALLEALGRIFSLRQARSRHKKKKNDEPGALAAFFRATGPFWRSNLLVRAFPGRPGRRFSSPKRMFFRCFSVRRACNAQKLGMCKNHSFSLVFCMSQASRTRAHQPKTYQNSIRTGLEARLATQAGLTSVPRRSMGASRASPGRLRAISERFGNPPGRSWDAPDAPQDVLGAPRLRPGASPERLGAPKTPQDRFWNDF